MFIVNISVNGINKYLLTLLLTVVLLLLILRVSCPGTCQAAGAFTHWKELRWDLPRPDHLARFCGEFELTSFRSFGAPVTCGGGGATASKPPRGENEIGL